MYPFHVEASRDISEDAMFEQRRAYKLELQVNTLIY